MEESESKRQKIGLMAIGDEILDGDVLDTNSNWLLKQIDRLNHDVKRVEVLPDELDEIGKSLRRFIRDKFQKIFLYGGIGPTHDDITVQAVASFLGREMNTDKKAKEFVKEQYRAYHEMGILKNPNAEEIPGAMKMTKLPTGSKIIKARGVAPGVYLKIEPNELKSLAPHQAAEIFIMPGVPSELKYMFRHNIKDHYLHKNPHRKYVKEIITKTEEARLYPTFLELKEKYPKVKIGSYPNIEKMHVRIRLKGKKDEVKKAARRLKEESKSLGPG